MITEHDSVMLNEQGYSMLDTHSALSEPTSSARGSGSTVLGPNLFQLPAPGICCCTVGGGTLGHAVRESLGTVTLAFVYRWRGLRWRWLWLRLGAGRLSSTQRVVKVIRTRLDLNQFLARFFPLDFAAVKGAKRCRRRAWLVQHSRSGPWLSG